MDKDEILELSRRENDRGDEREKEIGSQAKQVAFAVGTLLCVTFTILGAVFSDSFNSVPWAIYFCMTGTDSLVKFARLKKKSDLAIGILETVCGIAMTAFYVCKLVMNK